jgi:hypothetical protein
MAVRRMAVRRTVVGRLGWHSVTLVELELGESRANDNDSATLALTTSVGAGVGAGALNCILLTNDDNIAFNWSCANLHF